MSAKAEAVQEKKTAAKPALRVWRYEAGKPGVEDGDGQAEYAFTLRMPKGARITRVGSLSGVAQLFAVVNPAFREEERWFWVANTNSDLPGPEDLQQQFDEAGKNVEVVGLEPVGMWITNRKNSKGEWARSVAKHLFEIVVKPREFHGTDHSMRQPGEEG